LPRASFHFAAPFEYSVNDILFDSPKDRESFMRVDLAGKVALVTGAARNIGKAIADALAANGARVVYADIDAAGAESAAKTTNGLGLTLDVSNEAQVEAVIARVVREAGRLDILVNNAGINTMAHRVTIDQFPRSEWDRILAVDLTGAYLMSKFGSQVMVQQGTGRIINIASIAGLVPLRLQCPFVAAKAGLINLTKAMALELGPRGVLVNGIAPGSILTEGTKQLFYGEDGQFHANMQRMLDHVPLGRPGTSDEIAHAALFLAAPESSYINGHILTVDGGWTAGYTRDF
jgi:3-oxoacyl-[acyl-carrier protein] reductase